MQSKKACSSICKKYRVTKPTRGGRYESGHARCQICDMWIDYKGVHLKDGSPATRNSEGWFCNCCNYRVRMNPRNLEYKAKLRQPSVKIGKDVNLSHFDKRRAVMLRNLGRAMAQKEFSESYESFFQSVPRVDIESEFGVNFDTLIELAKKANPPNMISMIAEFEQIRYMLNRVPTKEDMKKYSEFGIALYEAEFKSWEHLLERLGYDPWYRDAKKAPRP